ncbi:hypothetical protein EDEG_03814 [Edhazardia aedis USNM 41457]|uniref:EF-hand domain-containing protein n=1 Tax=Edhazardia aedis (strain USNM 41457) TaxID=1003232 RepID=J9D233_EDHAE|nr:hypothetical protein EDEG_03814 [Edhazardia aedis USNM 41457]|eukprot:EJW01639.1 hypothetical protein EDEG_03814 [Edhazardia aedis USNM 41457]
MGNTKSLPDKEKEDVLSKFSHFNPHDVIFWYKSFEREFPNNLITLHDLEKIFKDLFPFGNCKLFVKHLFRTINIGNTQKIDFNELFIAFSILTKGSKFEKLRWIFRFYDIDNDGVVSKNEAMIIANALYEMYGRFFHMEVDVKQRVDEIFKELNIESGFLTFEDFLDFADNNPDMLIRLAILESN